MAQLHQRSGFKLLAPIRDFCERGSTIASHSFDLDFEPISKTFQEIGHAIRVGDHQINCIDVSRPYFLARDDLSPIRLPIHQIPHLLVIPLQQVPLEATVAVEEEIASSRLSLEEEIDQFCFVEDEGPSEKPVDISDFETKSTNLSSIHPKKLIITGNPKRKNERWTERKDRV